MILIAKTVFGRKIALGVTAETAHFYRPRTGPVKTTYL